MIPLVLILKILLYKPTILNNVLIFFFLFYVIIFVFLFSTSLFPSTHQKQSGQHLSIFAYSYSSRPSSLASSIVILFLCDIPRYMTCLMPIYQLMEYHFHIKDVIHAGLGELYPTEIGIYIYADGEGMRRWPNLLVYRPTWRNSICCLFLFWCASHHYSALPNWLYA